MKGTTLIALALAAVAMLMKSGSLDMPDLGGLLDRFTPTPAVEVEEPTGEIRDAVEPIRGVVEGKDAGKRSQLAALYRGMADVVRRHDDTLSTADVRAWLVDADTYHFQGTDLIGAFPGFGAAKDGAIKQVLGLESRELEPAEQKNLAELLDAIAWAVGS